MGERDQHLVLTNTRGACLKQTQGPHTPRQTQGVWRDPGRGRLKQPRLPPPRGFKFARTPHLTRPPQTRRPPAVPLGASAQACRLKSPLPLRQPECDWFGKALLDPLLHSHFLPSLGVLVTFPKLEHSG